MAGLERLLELAEIIESAADHELRLTFLAGALAHLFETVVDQIELELVLVLHGRGVQSKHPIFLNKKLTLPAVPRLPALRVKRLRTLPTVRVGLSVAHSTAARPRAERSPRK